MREFVDRGNRLNPNAGAGCGRISTFCECANCLMISVKIYGCDDGRTR